MNGLYHLGYPFVGGSADVGFSLVQLVGIMGGFCVLFLGSTVLLVWRRGRDGGS